jgi:uncharacterized membrane protein
MVDLLTYLNVNVLGLKAFHLNLFKGGMIALLVAIGVSILITNRTSQYLLHVTGRLNAATVKQQRMMGWGVGVAFTGFLIYLRVRQYFELQTMYDMTVEANVAWHMVHGPWFFNSLDHDSFLGGHFSLVFFLIGAIYRWAEHPITLLVIQSVALGGGAVAVYYVALARKTTTSVAVLAMALYVFNPYVHHISAHDFHLSPLAIPAILWMLYFIDSAQPWKAGAAALLSSTVEESILLPLVGVGLYLIAFRPQWRTFGLGLAFFSLTYFVVITKVLMPMFVPGRGLFFWDRYANLGGNLNEAIGNLLTHPLWAAMEALIRRNQYVYLVYFLLPVVFLPLFSLPEASLIVVPLTIMFLSQDPGMYKLGFHYSALALPFLFYGAVCGLSKLPGYPFWAHIRQKYGKILLSGIFFLLALNTYRSPGYDLGQTDSKFASSAFELSSLVPPDASVATALRFGPLLANRHYICRISGVPGEVCAWQVEVLSGPNWSKPLWHPQYVLIGVESDKTTSEQVKEQTQYAKWLTNSQGYEEIRSQDGIHLFRSTIALNSGERINKKKD